MGFAAPAAASATISAAIPDVWRASQLASYRTPSVPTGHAVLDRELSDGGWPSRTLIELLLPQPGIGEMRLLQPALRRLAGRAIALVQPPHPPQAAAWCADDFPVGRMMWVRPSRAADALWAAEQILRNGACGALVFWQAQVRNESLRRLHLAAQGADVVFWLLRPIACAQDASPAPLRMALRPAAGGIGIDIVKRRGPRREGGLVVPLPVPLTVPLTVPLASLPAACFPITESNHALVDRRASAVAAARNLPPALV